MVLSPEYQALDYGYGLILCQDKYYSMGWSVHLPDYTTGQRSDGQAVPGNILMFLELLAPFRSARESAWFKDRLARLEEYRTEIGTYCFPREWLPENQSGYWVSGAYMGMESERRGRVALECESTFRVLWIRHLMDKG
jgi:hypothetical protein